MYLARWLQCGEEELVHLAHAAVCAEEKLNSFRDTCWCLALHAFSCAVEKSCPGIESDFGAKSRQSLEY